jgi:hypothetical protein
MAGLYRRRGDQGMNIVSLFAQAGRRSYAAGEGI